MVLYQYLYAFGLLLLPIIAGCNAPVENSADNYTYYKVKKVSDGDTFWIDNGTKEGEKIRIIGIDAPESRATGKKQKQYFGEESKQYLTQLILNKEVRLEYDISKKDPYKRTLAYVYLRDDTFLNAHLIQNGYAIILTIQPNTKHADLFYKLQQEARENKRGLWKD
jgi:micrococcal nuclease